jgi:DNA-binding MarR family transcriptional regulator
MSSEDHARVRGDLAADESSPSGGAAAFASLQVLSDTLHDADEQALRAVGMLPIDARALRYLLHAERESRTVNPTQLARVLRLSTAGITKLIDRLVRDGRAERQPNPTDRRSIIISPAGTAEEDLARAYGHLRDPLVATIGALSDEEVSAVRRFASRLTDAIRQEFASPAS